MNVSDKYERITQLSDLSTLIHGARVVRHRQDLDVSAAYARASNEPESCLVEIWKEVLGLNDVGVDDSFFELGGDSLRAMQVLSRVGHRLGWEVGIDAFFESPTVRQLVATLSVAGDASAASRSEALEHDEPPGEATQSEQPSKTSVYVAACRALGAREPDESVRNPDYLAERLLGPSERAMIADQPVGRALVGEAVGLADAGAVATSSTMMVVRTRFIEEHLARAIQDGAAQLVILGAGFDSRAYRLRDALQGVRIFEVDQLATQRRKRCRLVEIGVDVPTNVTYVSADLRFTELREALRQAGYKPQKPTFVICEGVTMYLPQAAVIEVLDWVASQPVGSAVAFDFISAAVVGFWKDIPWDTLSAAKKEDVQRRQHLELGEPWVFGIPEGGEREFLARCGLTLHELLPVHSEESVKRFLIKSDGTRSVPEDFPRAERHPYWLAYAERRA